jgi:polyhydroxyalkanoate synthesis regulator phasin
MITLKTLGITTLTAISLLSLNACNRTNSTQKAVESSVSRVSIADGNARAEAYLNDAGRKIRMEIKNGEMTEEEGRLKYAAIAKRVEKRMARAKSKTANTDARARRARYKEASDKMIEMVKAGEITREQMEARLNRMKKAMASKDEPSDDCIELRKKLGEAVRNGEMTREEASKLWDEEGC